MHPNTAQPAPSAAIGDWTGGQITEHAHCLLQGNPGPMTLDGTNTWVLLAPGASEAIVIDPGEDERAHQQRIVDHVTALGARVGQIVLSHGHFDHSGGVPNLVELTGAPVRAVGRGHDDIGDGDRILAPGIELRAVTTPGHTTDSVSFVLEADHALFSGDTVLGRGTTVVAHPDGDLEHYLASLDRLHELTGRGPVTSILPGHGPTIFEAEAMVAFYRVHRDERLQQVRDALAGGARGLEAVLAIVYHDVPPQVLPAARLSLMAQLTYLKARGVETGE
ncbi:MBL fold metallo-hydrolase [Kribbia dieselivorans]|uniref:MBL fold metallo-hydrolase n=1 Tax=Kribbia dieselivorans TaxID=331526 RepID=UPI000A8BAC68|nr:MBL fold metallo-hydrolase [Kribbia dieselivorans]